MESRTLRYRTNVPFCNACSEERDSHCEVILILKLAYRTNLSLVESYFSLEIFLQDHRKIVSIQTSHEKCDDRYQQIERFVKKSGTTNSNQRVLGLFVLRRRAAWEMPKLFQSLESRCTL